MRFKEVQERFDSFKQSEKLPANIILKTFDARAGARAGIYHQHGSISLIKGGTYAELAAWMDGYYAATHGKPLGEWV